MALVLFTSHQYITAYTPIGDLVAWDEIEPTVNLVQDSWIQDILGTNFYNYLQAQYQAQALTADEITLMNYIKPTQAYRVAEQALPFINYQIKNKGVMTQNGDYSDSTDLSGIKYLRNELANRAEFYAKRLSNYLCDNASLFPEYITDNGTDMKPNKAGYDSDLAFWPNESAEWRRRNFYD